MYGQTEEDFNHKVCNVIRILHIECVIIPVGERHILDMFLPFLQIRLTFVGELKNT